MVVFQGPGRRTPAGSRKKSLRGIRQFELGRVPAFTGIGPKRLRRIRLMGGDEKIRLLSVDVCNLFDPKTKAFKKGKITQAVENPANRHFVRRNILTKGAIILTDSGKARITSKPGQDGTINAILIEGSA